MDHIRTQILPSKQSFAKIKAPHDLHLEAIAIYVATGFFLDSDTFFKDEVCLLPAHDHTIDENGFLVNSKPWFEWYYEPREISFDQTLKEYQDLLEHVIKDQIGENDVILPLSGGLDSRSQALILKNLPNKVHAYSYSFKGGYPEHKIAQKIAKSCGFKFNGYEIPEGYLWDCIDELSEINGCYSEFTHPRQMAILSDLKQMNGVFSLGHWGDVLFDRGAPDGTRTEDILPLLKKKMIKPDGLKLAKKLWEVWNLDGDFETYLFERIEHLISKINIDNINAKVRAFKTMQWAHRWTSTNLAIFERANPITLPFYDNRMCQFICTVPEEYLADRKLQLAHLRTDDALASITWHSQKPFNIKNFHLNKAPFNLPYRVMSKLKREINGVLGNPFIQRNFELQFLGPENDEKLRSFLFNKDYHSFIPKEVVSTCYNKFKNEDIVRNSHAVSMLLTLSQWYKTCYKSN